MSYVYNITYERGDILNTKKLLFSLSIITVFIFSTLVGCSKNLDSTSIENFSKPIVVNILTAINNKNYTNFTQDFSQDMKNLSTDIAFKDQVKLIKKTIGNYESCTFLKATEKQGFIKALYKCNFSDEPKDVIVTITFKKDDSTHKVQGLFISSPKLNKETQ